MIKMKYRYYIFIVACLIIDLRKAEFSNREKKVIQKNIDWKIADPETQNRYISAYKEGGINGVKQAAIEDGYYDNALIAYERDPEYWRGMERKYRAK